MISVDGLKVEFGVKPLFEDVSFVVNDRDRIALVGKNGAGKSTMLKILCGLQKPTAGTVSVPNETTIGYLPQVMKLTDDTTVREEAYKAFSDITRLKERVDELNRQLEERTDYESEEYLDLVQRFTNAHDRYMMMGADNCDANLERTLTGLGFLQSDFDRPTSEFSGGWRMRIELAKILLQSPDVLLLDEPTNHLDIESIQWLEQFLSQSAKAVVLVSHDRAFINNVTNRTLEISCGKVVDYKVNYDQYVVLRKERREQQQRAYENQQKEIAEMKDFIERFRYKPTKAVQVQSRIKQLAKIVPIEIDEVDNSQMRLKFPPCLRSGDYPVICDGVRKEYGEHAVFSNVNLTIKRGEKVAFVGATGAGKSSILNLIGRYFDIQKGEILIDGVNIKDIDTDVLRGAIGQVQQDVFLFTGDIKSNISLRNENITLDEIKAAAKYVNADSFISKMPGGYDEPVTERGSTLSAGQRQLISFARTLAYKPSILVLDEATANIDTETESLITEAMEKLMTGRTTIMVAHRLSTIQHADKIMVMDKGRIVESGNHQELLMQNGVYRKLYDLQLAAEVTE